MAKDWASSQPEWSPGGGTPAPQDSHSTGLSQRAIIWMVVGGVVTVSALALVVQNSNKVEMEWLFFDFKAALWLFFVLTLLGGMVLGQVLMFFFRRARHKSKGQRHPEQA